MQNAAQRAGASSLRILARALRSRKDGPSLIDLVAYYAKRKDKALEDGDKRLAVRYARLEEAERIARSGKLSDRESALLSPDIAFIHLHAGGLVAECGYCGCVVDEKWDFCARCGVHFVDCRYVAEFGDLDA